MERKKAKNRYSNQTEGEKAQLVALLNAVGDGILAFDTDGRIILYNNAAIQILGYALYVFYQKTGELNIVGKKLSEIVILRDYNAKKVDILKNVLKKRLPEVRDDLYFVVKKRKTRLYTNLTPVFDDEENVERLILLMRDITDEKEFQEEQQEFISVTGHELRTPIAAIEANLSTALMPRATKMDEKARRYIKQAYSHLRFLSKIVESFTALQQAERKEAFSAEDIESFHPNVIIEDLVDEFADVAKKKGIKIRFLPSGDDVPKITTSKTKLKEVVMNAVDNAIKYTSGGQITISTYFKPGSTHVMIKIKDTGIGMSPEVVKKLFTKFYRAENWRTPKTRGTGLGLYISKRIMEHLGGEIKVDSKPKKGTTIIVSVPVLPTKPLHP